MKQFFSKLFKSSRKVNFLGIPESKFISDPNKIESSINHLIDDMVEFNKKQRLAVKDKLQMCNSEYRKQWQFPRMARIELSNFILLPEDFPAVLEYLGFPVATSSYEHGKFYLMDNLYSAIRDKFDTDYYSFTDTPYFVYTNNSIYFLFTACGYVVLICDKETFDESFSLVDTNAPGPAKDYRHTVIMGSHPKTVFSFGYNSGGKGYLFKSSVQQFLGTDDVIITPESIKFPFLRKHLSYTKIKFAGKQGNTDISEEKMSPQEFKLYVKKLHMEYLENLEKIFQIYGKSSYYTADELSGRKGFKPETYSGTIKVLLPFEILYRSVNEIPHVKTLL